jgi:two-component system KDP operon response regulator KdpE
MSDDSDKKITVLMIEDEIHMRRMLHVCLEGNGYEVVEATTGQEGLAQALRHQPDVVLLDLGLPDGDGQDVLKRLREWSQTPIFVVSVRNREDDKIKALDNGANDYITKPFGTGELLARLRVIRRYGQPASQAKVFTSGHLEVDMASRSVRVKGRLIKLTATEYALLFLFVRHAGKLLTHGYLLREIWGATDIEKTAPLRVYVGYLREKLETNPAKPQLLITEAGVGYRLVLQD